jgi:hypothetical protein
MRAATPGESPAWSSRRLDRRCRVDRGGTAPGNLGRAPDRHGRSALVGDRCRDAPGDPDRRRSCVVARPVGRPDPDRGCSVGTAVGSQARAPLRRHRRPAAPSRARPARSVPPELVVAQFGGAAHRGHCDHRSRGTAAGSAGHPRAGCRSRPPFADRDPACRGRPGQLPGPHRGGSGRHRPRPRRRRGHRHQRGASQGRCRPASRGEPAAEPAHRLPHRQRGPQQRDRRLHSGIHPRAVPRRAHPGRHSRGLAARPGNPCSRSCCGSRKSQPVGSRGRAGQADGCARQGDPPRHARAPGAGTYRTARFQSPLHRHLSTAPALRDQARKHRSRH